LHRHAYCGEEHKHARNDPHDAFHGAEDIT
jgi:hypothetical protein